MTVVKRQIEPPAAYCSLQQITNEKVSPPTDVAKDAAVSDMVGVLGQLGMLACYATEMFKEIADIASETNAGLARLGERVEAVKSDVIPVESSVLGDAVEDPLQFYSVPPTKWGGAVHPTQELFHPRTRSRMIVSTYEQCQKPPALHQMDKYASSGHGACMKKFSNPEFFRQEWEETERLRQEQELQRLQELKNLRRRNRGKTTTKREQKVAKVQQAQSPLSNMGVEFAGMKVNNAGSFKGLRKQSRVDVVQRSFRNIDVKSIGRLQHTASDSQQDNDAINNRTTESHNLEDKVRSQDYQVHGRHDKEPTVPIPQAVSSPASSTLPSKEKQSNDIQPLVENAESLDTRSATCTGTVTQTSTSKPKPRRAAPPPPRKNTESRSTVQQSITPSNGIDDVRATENQRDSTDPDQSQNVVEVTGAADPSLEKYTKMQKLGLPQGAIEHAMMKDGVNPECLFGAATNTLTDNIQTSEIPTTSSNASNVPTSQADPLLEKYRKMQKIGLPRGAIEQSMIKDGLTPSMLFGSESTEASKPETKLPAVDPVLEKYTKMQKLGLPQGAIEQSMMNDGVDPSLLFGNASAQQTEGQREIPQLEAKLPAVDPALAKYTKMQKLGLPQGAIEHSMMKDGVDPSLLFGGMTPPPTSQPTPSSSNASVAPKLTKPAGGLLDEIQQGAKLNAVEPSRNPVVASSGAATDLLAAIQQGAKLKPASARPEAPVRQSPATPEFGGASLLAAIQNGGARLRKVEKTTQDERRNSGSSSGAAAGGGVAAILARRIAIMGGGEDQGSSSDESDSDWDEP